MTELTRRLVLTGAAAATTLTAVGPGFVASPAHAAAPPAGKQAPGWYRYKVGSIEVTAVTDGARTMPLADNYVKNAPKDAVNAALDAGYMEKDKITAPFTPVVVNTGSKLVVIDTGLGPTNYEQSKGAVGQFATNLAAAGIDANTIDTVIISHFHGDHINGLLTADNKLAFPNSEVMVPAAEWTFWSDDGNMSKAPAGSPLEGNFKNIRRVFGALGNKVTQYEAGKELVPGITSVATPGHTPGHVSHVVASGSGKVLVQADVTASLGVLFVRNPGWHAVFDMDGPMAEQTRRKLYDMAATERMPIQGFHFPFPALGYIEKDGANYRLVPAAWNPVL
jgi:glyoxylase-like metal-dependent hydrolase (beta-lactamase superfamily II)